MVSYGCDRWPRPLILPLPLTLTAPLTLTLTVTVTVTRTLTVPPIQAPAISLHLFTLYGTTISHGIVCYRYSLIIWCR